MSSSGARPWCFALALAAFLPCSDREIRGDGESGPDPEVVQAAMAKGAAYLRAAQRSDGSWGEIPGGIKLFIAKKEGSYDFPVGPTALALYALLECGVKKDDATVMAGFAYAEKTAKRWVANTGGISSYEMSAMILAITARAGALSSWRTGGTVKLEGNDLKMVQGWVDALVRARPSNAEGWRYNLPKTKDEPGGFDDLSSTELAAVALFAADRCGVKVESRLWGNLIFFAKSEQEEGGPEWERAVDDSLPALRPRAIQKPAGASDKLPSPPSPAASKDSARGFAYRRWFSTNGPDEREATGGMTAAGLITILLAREALGKRPDDNTALREKAKTELTVIQSLYDGCAWLDAHWSALRNPGKQTENVYNLLYVEHVAEAMDLLGSARIGAHDWRREMSEQVLGRQRDDGSWDTETAHEPRKVLDTCFALLFLARPFGAPPASDAQPPASKVGK